MLKPRLTEKSAILSESRGVYVFNVDTDATKLSIVKEIKDKHKVTPLSVHLVAVPGKRTVFKGVRGAKGKAKKAYVYLKKGDKIDFA